MCFRINFLHPQSPPHNLNFQWCIVKQDYKSLYFRLLLTVNNVLASWATVSFSERALQHDTQNFIANVWGNGIWFAGRSLPITSTCALISGFCSLRKCQRPRFSNSEVRFSTSGLCNSNRADGRTYIARLLCVSFVLTEKLKWQVHSGAQYARCVSLALDWRKYDIAVFQTDKILASRSRDLLDNRLGNYLSKQEISCNICLRVRMTVLGCLPTSSLWWWRQWVPSKHQTTRRISPEDRQSSSEIL